MPFRVAIMTRPTADGIHELYCELYTSDLKNDPGFIEAVTPEEAKAEYNLDASHLLEAQRHSNNNNTNTNTNNVNVHVHNQPGPRRRSPSARRVNNHPASSSTRNVAPVGATNTYVHSMSGGTMVIAPCNRVGIARNAASAAAAAAAPTAVRRVHNGARRHRDDDYNDYDYDDEAIGGGPARGWLAAPRGGVAGDPLGAEDPGREAVERGLRLRFAMEMGFGFLAGRGFGANGGF
ncbi:hypothetical protein ColKHC_12812 [Colletotrichum higginsianum]|uniref:Uncharacterized protein n=1 Tax=Colletotrichum higginsianum TaxID=80884 RepID=A0A4T0VEN0_9PEZI|nr:hypothetical protein CH35J_011795 [Colletotrichum higginsianum]GJD03987.1 hypothetical protein ColKHC_12812 [Colletotrichum higginsianum]